MMFTPNSDPTTQKVTKRNTNGKKMSKTRLRWVDPPANGQQDKGREGEIKERGMDRQEEHIHTL